MKRFFSFILASVVVLLTYAQQRGASDFNTDEFPNVSFVWNEYNPDVISGNQVSLKEDGQLRSITWRNISPSRSVEKHKSIVILWEDMYSHGVQSDFTSAMLRSFFSNGIKSNDYFNIIAFNRDKGDGNFMQSITSGFTNSLAEIQNVLFFRKNSGDTFLQNPKCANIYQALNEAVALLEKEPKDNLKVIILISAGKNMNTAGAPREFVCEEALRRNIPIYIVKYPLDNDFSQKEIEGIEKVTFGELIVPSGSRDAQGTAAQLLKAYNNMSVRHYGQDYKITFTSLGKRNGKAHNIILNINGIDHKISYSSPEFSLKIWMQENIGLTIIIGCAILLLLAIIIFLIVYLSKKRKEKDMALQQKNELLKVQMEEQKKEMQAKLDAERKVREGAEIAARQKEEAARLESQQKELENIMRAKNLYPRLVFAINGETRTEVVGSPITKIGRDNNNDVILNKPTISREHAIISFNGAGFEIQNVSKTNKTIVNGQFIDKIALKANDIIGIGEVVINFYI